jgi:hypothetical protein
MMASQPLDADEPVSINAHRPITNEASDAQQQNIFRDRGDGQGLDRAPSLRQDLRA